MIQKKFQNNGDIFKVNLTRICNCTFKSCTETKKDLENSKLRRNHFTVKTKNLTSGLEYIIKILSDTHGRKIKLDIIRLNPKYRQKWHQDNDQSTSVR